MVEVDSSEFVIADIPGLIKGASSGKGIGDKFLSHVERSSVLLHIVDGTSSNIIEDSNVVLEELKLYSPILSLKPRLTVLNKIDALSSDEIEEKVKALSDEIGVNVLCMSGVSKKGITAVLRQLKMTIDNNNNYLDHEENKSVNELDNIKWEP